jgi:myo-inositol-1(or 4)-monophosphatase
MTLKLSNELNVAIDAARKAGIYLRECFGSVSPKDITYKGDINIVTPFDMEAQRLILRTLKSRFPDHRYFTEEEQDKPTTSSSTQRWIIDPLDGTSNYASGSPHFCVSMALEVSGQLALGVVYSPMLDELFYAVRGGGAFLNGKPIHVSLSPRLQDAIIATGFPYDNTVTLQECLRLLSRIAPAIRTTRCLGAAALDICYVACGRLDAYWDVELEPWDMSAGALIVSEAGGQISNVRGQRFDHCGHNLLASNGALHTAILDTLWLENTGDLSQKA